MSPCSLGLVSGPTQEEHVINVIDAGDCRYLGKSRANTGWGQATCGKVGAIVTLKLRFGVRTYTGRTHVGKGCDHQS